MNENHFEEKFEPPISGSGLDSAQFALLNGIQSFDKSSQKADQKKLNENQIMTQDIGHGQVFPLQINNEKLQKPALALDMNIEPMNRDAI